MSTLDDIKKRAENATEGPWRIETDSELDYEQGIPFSEWPSVLIGPENADPSDWAKKHGETRRIQEVAELNMDDAEFIAHARTDVPKLVAALEAVQQYAEGAQPFVLFGGAKASGIVQAETVLKIIEEALA